ncbi:MAG: hypothetical protein AAF790_00500 [Planctomycetota bacterium]
MQLLALYLGIPLVVLCVGAMTCVAVLDGDLGDEMSAQMIIWPNVAVWGGSLALLLLRRFAERRGQPGPSTAMVVIMPATYLIGWVLAFVLRAIGVEI